MAAYLSPAVLCIIFDDTAFDLLAYHTLLASFFAVVSCFYMGLGSRRLAGGDGGCLI